MRKHHIVPVLLAVLSWNLCIAASRPQQDISAALSRAEAFYNAKQFFESIILLTELERRAGAGPQGTNDLLKVKLYLGLAHLGMDQTDQARSKFVEVCKLDGKFTLDPKDYSSKVIGVFEDAKASCMPSPARPPGPMSASISQSTFQQGRELYDKGQFADALKYFNVVLALDSSHELAREYLKLVQQRIELSAEQAYMDWRTNFNARQFDKAAAAYEKLRADSQSGAAKLAVKIESEYGQGLSGLINDWRAACGSKDQVKVDALRSEAIAMSFGFAFNRDALAQMQQCPASLDRALPPAPATPATQTQSTAVSQRARSWDCVQGDASLALVRLKSRVNPQIEPGLQRYVGRGIVVSILIDEEGNVTVNGIARANARIAEALKNAVEQWKFHPAIIDNQPRCVVTDLPITLIQP